MKASLARHTQPERLFRLGGTSAQTAGWAAQDVLGMVARRGWVLGLSVHTAGPDDVQLELWRADPLLGPTRGGSNALPCGMS